jgi:hypothetical protein
MLPSHQRQTGVVETMEPLASFDRTRQLCESSDRIMAESPGEIDRDPTPRRALQAAARAAHLNCSSTNHFLSLSEHFAAARGGSADG